LIIVMEEHEQASDGDDLAADSFFSDSDQDME
jgi:hypothetical protein